METRLSEVSGRLHPLAHLEAPQWKAEEEPRVGAEMNLTQELRGGALLTAVLVAYRIVRHVLVDLPSDVRNLYYETMAALGSRRRGIRPPPLGPSSQLTLEQLDVAVQFRPGGLPAHVRSEVVWAIRGVVGLLEPRVGASVSQLQRNARRAIRASLRAYAYLYEVRVPYAWWDEAVRARLAFVQPSRATDVQGR